MKKDYKDLKVGREFDVRETDAERALLKERTRTALAVFLCATSVTALGFAALGSDAADASDNVKTVWVGVGPLLGGVIGYYFRGTRSGGERDD